MKTTKLVLLGFISFFIPIVFYYQANKIDELEKAKAQAKADSTLGKLMVDSARKTLQNRFNIELLKVGYDLGLMQEEIKNKQGLIELYKEFGRRPTNIKAEITLPTSSSTTPDPRLDDFLTRINKIDAKVSNILDSINKRPKPPSPKALTKCDSLQLEIDRLASRLPSLSGRPKRTTQRLIDNLLIEYYNSCTGLSKLPFRNSPLSTGK